MYKKSFLKNIDLGSGNELEILIIPTVNDDKYDIVIEGKEAGTLSYNGKAWEWKNSDLDQTAADIIGKEIEEHI